MDLTDFNPYSAVTYQPTNEELISILPTGTTLNQRMDLPTQTRTPVPTHTLEPTFTPQATPTLEATPIPLTRTSIGQQPTYTPYPTYTPQQPQVQVVVQTSPPQIIQQPQLIPATQIVVQVEVVEIPVTVVEYQVVTATLSATPPITPTPWAEEPEYFVTDIPIFGLTTTRGRHAPDS